MNTATTPDGNNMKKLKTSELTGEALDWMVTSIEEPDALRFGVADWQEQRSHTVKRGEYLYRWSSSWAQGGPIIHREKIDHSFGYSGPDTCTAWPNHMVHVPTAQVGPTLLIAAMRAYIASKMGDEVDVPDGL